MSTGARDLEPRRLLAELQALREAFPALRLLAPEFGASTLEGQLDVDGETRWIRLGLPPGYPAIPPELREIEGPRGPVIMRRGTAHRLSDGTVCLFPHGNHAQAWRHDRLAVDAVRQFVALIRQERAAPRASPRVLKVFGRLVVPPTAGLLRAPEGRGVMHVRRAGPERGDMFVDTIVEERIDCPVRGILGEGWRAALPHTEEVFWLRAPLPAEWRSELRGSAALDELLEGRVPAALKRRFHDAPVGVLIWETDGDHLDALVVRRPPDNIGALYVSDVVIGTPDELVFRRTDPVLPQRSALAETAVVLVGLGSLGGAVALALARAGATRFVLIDPDVLEPENISRHVGSITDLGRPKVDVVADKLRAISPDAQIVTIAKSLAWDLPAFGAGAELERYLAWAGRALLISTCALPHVDRQINALAIRAEVPVVFASALGAAEHGRIFRVIPGTTACYACVCASQDERPDDFPRFALQTPAIAPYVEPALPGLGVDITQIAMIAARFALQSLSRAFGLDLGVGDERSDHLLWTNRGGWLFDRPLQARAEHFPRRPDCPVCGEPPERSLATEEAAALERLTREMMNPDPPDPGSSQS